MSRTRAAAEARKIGGSHENPMELALEIDGLLSKLSAALKSDLPALNKLLVGRKLPPVDLGPGMRTTSEQ